MWETLGTVRDLGRLQEIAGVLIRYGFGDMVRRIGMSGALERTGRLLRWDDPEAMAHMAPPERVRCALQDLGPTFVKLGQVMATRVDLLPPGSVFTMASPNSPLLLVTRNALPFPVRVNIEVSAPAAIQVDPVGVIQIPAAGSWTLQVPTQSDSDGGVRHTVTFALSAPGGQALSAPVEISVPR